MGDPLKKHPRGYITVMTSGRLELVCNECTFSTELEVAPTALDVLAAEVMHSLFRG